MSEELVKYEMGLTSNLVQPGDIMRVIDHVHQVIKEAMKEGIDGDYGVIPGTAKKTLLKPGAEKLLMAFGLTATPRPPKIIDLPEGHREVTVETEIVNMRSGFVHTVGLGSCSTMESKYRYRKADLTCPECGAATIIKGKAEFGGGWLCYQKKGGCGKKWTDADNPFEGVSVGKIEHEDPADYYNTVLKMASKRSMIDGAIRATASSAMFSQDMDDDIPPTSNKTGSATSPPMQAPQEKVSEDDSIISGVDNVTIAHFKKKDNSQGTKYVIHAGEKYETFSKTIAEEAKRAKEAGLMVTITYHSDAYGRKLDTLTVQEPPREPGSD